MVLQYCYVMLVSLMHVPKTFYIMSERVFLVCGTNGSCGKSIPDVTLEGGGVVPVVIGDEPKVSHAALSFDRSVF